MDLIAVVMMLLIGSEWGVMGGGEAPSLQFNDGTVSGSGGCNRFAGPYTQDGDSLRMGVLAASQMVCTDEAVMAKERDWFAMIEAVRSVDASHAVLILKDASGTVLVKLARRDWD
jgi:heat shock protein HslJ